MSVFGSRQVFRKARTAASFPARLVDCEDRCNALDVHVSAKIDEMRSELAELRMLLSAQADATADATALIGRLLQASEARLQNLEAGHAPSGG